MSRLFRLEEGWLTVGLLALLLFSVTLSVQQAQWSDGLSILTPVTIVGLATGIILAKVRRVPRFLLDLVGLGVGIVTVLVAVSSVMQDPRLVTIQDRVQDLLKRTATWVNVAVRQDMSDDLVVFILSLAVVCWVLAYSSAYFVFKSRQLWWALVPNGIALLINLSYSIVNLNSYIIVFMFSALLLMTRFNLLLKEERWQRDRINYSPTLTWAFLWAGSLASLVLALAMWYVPTTAVNYTLNGIWEQVNQPWDDFQTRMSELWSPVNGNQTVGGYSSFNKSFTMGGSVNLSDATALIVNSRERHYWRAGTYDLYSGTGWKDTAEENFTVEGLSPRLALEANQQLVSQDELRREITYTVQVVNPKKDIVFASLRPVRLSIPSRLALSWRRIGAVYNIDDLYAGADGSQLARVPLELRSLVGRLREAQRELRDQRPDFAVTNALDVLVATQVGPQIIEQIEELSKREQSVVPEIVAGSDYAIQLRVNGEFPVYEDIVAIHGLNNLSRNEKYDVVSLVSLAGAPELRAAGTDYESWVTSRYLDVPATVSQRVRDLTQEIVDSAGAQTPYDKAKAIETYLRRTFRYSTSIGQPPSGLDRVEWFLFDVKEGYCEYYATAMIVMLRMQGVPVRMATGYAPGSYDRQRQAYIVKESDAHAWPEVYFPDYGWIEFEPTPSQAVVSSEPEALTEAIEPTPTASAQTSPTPRLDDRDEGVASTRRNQGGGIDLDMPFGWAGWLVLLALAIPLSIIAYRWQSAMRKARPPLSAKSYYGKMLLWSRFLKLGPSAHQTPYEFSETLSREVPGTSQFTKSIARAYVRERFGRTPVSLNERHTLNRAWTSLRGRMVRTLPSSRLRRSSLGSRKGRRRIS